MNENSKQKEILLAKISYVTELIKADPALQDNVREEDRKTVENLIKEINTEYDAMMGSQDADLREARNELDDVLKEHDESLDIFENVGFEETITDAELDTMMERLVDSMLMSGEQAIQINTLTEEMLEAPYGKYQLQTEELKLTPT